MLNFLTRRLNDQINALQAELRTTRSEVAELQDELSEMRFKLEEATLDGEQKYGEVLNTFAVQSNGMMTATNFLTRTLGGRPTHSQMKSFSKFTIGYTKARGLGYTYADGANVRTYDVSTLEQSFAAWCKRV